MNRLFAKIKVRDTLKGQTYLVDFSNETRNVTELKFISCTLSEITSSVFGVERCSNHHFVGNFVSYLFSYSPDVALFILNVACDARRHLMEALNMSTTYQSVNEFPQPHLIPSEVGMSWPPFLHANPQPQVRGGMSWPPFLQESCSRLCW